MTPNAKQNHFASIRSREAFFGAPSGGGNTAALVSAAIPGCESGYYRAVILCRDPRRLPQLQRHVASFLPPEASWIESSSGFAFPSGASILLGSLEKTCSAKRYATQFHFIGFDRVLDFSEEQYLAMAPKAVSLGGERPAPARVRSSGDPEGPHRSWVVRRLLSQDHVVARPEDCGWFTPEDFEEFRRSPELCW